MIKRSMTHLAAAATLFVCLFLLPAALMAQPPKPAPDFTLNDLDGRKVTLSALRGKVVILNFWGSWCAPCKAEMPSLNRLHLEFGKRNFSVLAVSIDPSEQPVRSYIAAKGYSFPVLLDKDREIYFDAYGLVGLPISFIIDKNGMIVRKIIGETEWDSPRMKEEIQKLLESK